MMVLTTTERVLAAREAGAVQRSHTARQHGDYTVGQHSYDALSLLFLLHPDPSMNLVKAVLWHDAAERWLGDVPAPAKWDDEDLRIAYEKAERGVLRKWGFDEGLKRLTDPEQDWLAAVDKLELWLWCMDQVAMGNQNIYGVRDRINDWFNRNRDDIPLECLEFIGEFHWRRLDDRLNP